MYSDAYILVTGDITVTRTIAVPAGSPAGTQPQRKQVLTAATQVAFKNFARFKDCRTQMSDPFVDYANFINIAIPIYNLVEYKDNYSHTSGSLWGFEREEVANNADVTNKDNAPSCKCKAKFIDDTEVSKTKHGIK